MKLIWFYISCISLIVVASCNNKELKTHSSGLQYRYITHNENAPSPEDGDILELNIIYTTPGDSVLFNSKEIPGAFRMKKQPPASSGGDIQHAFSVLNEGDSLYCKVNAKQFYNKTKRKKLPAFLSPDDKLQFYIKLKNLYSPETYKKIRNRKKKIGRQQEKSRLRKYLEKKDIKRKATDDEIYFIRKNAGNGDRVETNDSVKIHYTGKVLNGHTFKDTRRTRTPFAFSVGSGKIIPGLKKGVMKMREGGKARMIIPSNLAYGKEGLENIIPPFSTLIFDVEIIEVIKHKNH